MGNGMIVMAGALVLVGMFMLSANNLLFDNSAIAEQNEHVLTSISLAQSLIEEAKTKGFDQKTVSSPAILRDSLTASSALGRDGMGEAVPSPDTVTSQGFRSALVFNDIDDYRGYRRRIDTGRAEGYELRCALSYVSETCPDSTRALPSYCKRMTVTVTNRLLPAAVTMSYVFTY